MPIIPTLLFLTFFAASCTFSGAFSLFWFVPICSFYYFEHKQKNLIFFCLRFTVFFCGFTAISFLFQYFAQPPSTVILDFLFLFAFSIVMLLFFRAKLQLRQLLQTFLLLSCSYVLFILISGKLAFPVPGQVTAREYLTQHTTFLLRGVLTSALSLAFLLLPVRRKRPYPFKSTDRFIIGASFLLLLYLLLSPTKTWFGSLHSTPPKNLQKYTTKSTKKHGVLLTKWSNKTSFFSSYIYLHPKTKPAPLLFFIPGSGSFSSFGFWLRKWKKLAAENQWHTATVDKVGLVPTLRGTQQNSDIFHDFDRLSIRVQQVNRVLNYILKRYKHNISKLYIFAHSEGVDVSSRVVANRKDIDGLVISGGGGVHAFDEMRLGARYMTKFVPFLSRLKIFFIDNYLWSKQKEIFVSTEQSKFLGLSFFRWRSYSNTHPFTFFAKSNSPILSIHGSRDFNSSIKAARILKKSMLQRKKDFALHTIDGMDHSFRDKHGKDLVFQVFKQAITWFRTTNRQGTKQK